MRDFRPSQQGSVSVFAVGDKLGAYTLRRRIGAGGLGAVYLAEQQHIGRKAAVKVLLAQLSCKLFDSISQAQLLTIIVTPHCATTLSGTNLGGHNDWRLPSVMELVSLVDFGVLAPSINATYFPATPANYFASSSPWIVNFNGGATLLNDFAPLLNVRCVR